jgi:phosphoenolpyruvate carboxykinase (GTP)
MASEKTAAAAGKVGELRRDPMAMIPFCGYNMADYWQHWLDMGKLIPKAPKIFNVNWFRTDENGHFVWPGFGDNMRVLMWIMDRCLGKAEAVETPIGFEPRPQDIDVEGLDGVDEDTVRSLLYVDRALWKEDCAGIREFYAKFGGRVPKELTEELDKLERSLEQ